MPRRRLGEPPAYQVHPTRKYAYVFVGGRQIYLGVHGTQEARDRYSAIVAEWEREHQQDVAADAPRSRQSTVLELAAAFLGYAKQHYRLQDGTQTSEFNLCRAAMRHLLESHGERRIADFMPREMKAVQRRLVEKKYSRKTVNKLLSLIRRAFKWGVSEQLVDESTYGALLAVDGLKAGRTVAPDYEDVTPAPLRNVVRAMRRLPRQIQAMIRLQWYCGARPGEVCRMRGAEINQRGLAKVKSRTIAVGDGIWVFQPRQSKTGGAIYLLGPRAQAVLKPFLRDDPKEYLFQPRESVAQWRAARRAARKRKLCASDYQPKQVPKTQPGERYTTSSYGSAILMACRRTALADGLIDDVKLPSPYDWAPNQLRHSFVTANDRRAGVAHASIAVGHKKLETTLIYLERNLRGAADVLRKHG